MFPIILIAVLTAVCVLSIKGGIFADEHNRLEIGIASLTGGVTAVVMLIVAIVVWPAVYFDSVGEVTKMEAFYHDTLESYEYTITATGDIEITNAQAGVVDVAYNQQGVATSERLKELRDKVEWFNARLRHYERFNSMFVADAFLADMPDDLVPITLSVK